MNQRHRLKQCLLVLCVLGAVVGMGLPAEAQEVLTCSQARLCTLRWTPNTEEDMAQYRIYVSRTSGAYDMAHPAAVIAHPAESRTTTGLGTLADGRHFVVLTAVDEAGNASGPSNEVEFIFDAPPGTPVLELIQVTIP